MTLPVFVIGQGAVYLTPQSSDLATMTFCHEGQYTKLRDIDVGLCYSPLVEAKMFYPEDAWFYIGQASHQVFIRTKSLCDAIDRLKNPGVQQRVHQVVSQFFGRPFCPALEGESVPLATSALTEQTFPLSCPDLDGALIHWLGRGFKITTAMCSQQHPVVVASKTIYRGCSKIHKQIVILHSPYPSDVSLIGKVFILTKVPSGVSEKGLGRELQISRGFVLSQVPNVLELSSVVRGTGMQPDGKVKHGLLSEYFEGGTLQQYILRHFSSFTNSLIPVYRQGHLALALQIATALYRINFLNFVHGDVRPENILVRLTENGPEAVLADFGLTDEAGLFTTRALGFYPPPEAQPLKGRPEAHKDEDPCSQGKEEPYFAEICLTVDSWAFGIVLFTLFHGFSFDLMGLSFKQDRETILTNRERLIAVLSPEGSDAIDDLIRGLLDIVPTRRLHSFHAVQALEKIISMNES